MLIKVKKAAYTIDPRQRWPVARGFISGYKQLEPPTGIKKKASSGEEPHQSATRGETVMENKVGADNGVDQDCNTTGEREGRREGVLLVRNS